MSLFRSAMEAAGTVIDVLGVAVIAGGIVVAAVCYFRSAHHFDSRGFRGFRQNLGRGILLGLEFLVAADIIRTVAVAPTLENVLVLGVIVLIRTFLSFALEVELEGRWPWQRRGAVSDETAQQADAT